MKIVDCLQKSPEWYAARCGIPTASSFDMIVTSKGEPSTQRKKYLYRLAGERICQVPEETYQSAAMARGIEVEEEARRFYEFTKGVEVQQVGFCLSDCGRYGASPDGLVGEDGILEIKCPTLAVHVEYLLSGTLPTAYVQQTQGQLLVTGRKWSDFISYYPGLPPLLIRVEQDAKFQRYLAAELDILCSELEHTIAKIK